MICYLRRADAQVVNLISRLRCVSWKNVSWVVSIMTESITELSQVLAPARTVGLAVNRPQWSPRLDFLGGIDNVIRVRISCNPVRVGPHVPGNGLARRGQGHLLEGGVLRAHTSVHRRLHADIDLITA